MKKILSFIIIAVLCLGVLSSCDVINGLINPTPEHTHNYVGGVCECGEVDPNATFYPERAAEYIVTQYNKENPVTAADYEVYGQVRVGGVVYTVDWSVDNELVKLVDNGSTWLVNVDEKSESEQKYKLTGLITAPDGTTATVSFDRTVPEYAVISFEEYMAAEKGATVTVEGIVVGINAHSLNNKYNHLYLMDASGKGGYYCYKLKADPAEAGVKVGMTVSVSGTVEPYSGMQEIKDGSFQIVDETIKTITPVDVTTNFAAGEPLTNFVAMPVVIKGVTIGAQDLEKDTSQYLYFSIGEEKGYVRTYVSDFINLTINKEGDAYTSPDKATIDAAHAEKFGWTANVTGILVLYGVENPYIIPTSVECFEYLEYVEKTAEEKIAAELEGISVPEAITENTTLTLPLVGKYYNDVKIAWTVDNTAYTVGEDGKLEIKLGAEKVTLTLTATLTCGDKTETKTLEVAVDAAAADLYVPKATTAPVAGTAYKFFLFQNKLGKTLYITGEITGGRYIVTTDKISKAADVYVETVEGGVKFYILDGETKLYITVYKNDAGKDAVKFDAAGTSVFAYNATVNAWVTNVDGTDKYLGTYGTYNTVSASNLSYITAENTGKEQFPAGFATIEFVVENECEHVWADATCTSPKKCTECGETEGDPIAHSYTDHVCTGCGADDPEYYWPMSLTEAAAAKDGKLVQVSGTVTADDKNNSVTIKDADGNTLYIYKLATPVAVGDVITVTGEMGTHKDSRQIAQGATAVITTAHTCEYNAATCVVKELCKYCGAEKEGSALADHTWGEATCTAPKTCSVCNKTEGETAAHVYGEDGKCVCGITNGQSIVVVNFATYAADNNWEDGKMQNTVNADANVTITAGSNNTEVSYGNNTGKYYVSDATWRIYQADAPVVTVKAAEGKTIKSVKVTFTVKNEGAFAIGETIVSSGELITVDANSVSFTVINDGTGTKTNGQVLITAIEVIYE